MADTLNLPQPVAGDAAFHLRRARQERDLARLSSSPPARLAHRELAELHEAAAREAAEAEA